jgi:single-stranded-DNA-specific exonuclease
LQLLYDRGLDTQEKIDEFFNPDYLGDLHDPFLMLGMKEAAERILKAITRKEKIVVFADYDCDGVCGSIILKEVIEKIGGVVEEVYIPDKVAEGYGLNSVAVENFKKNGIQLLITVDCGITNHREIKLAKSLGIEVIVVDHHQVVGFLPEAIVIDPHQPEDFYPFKDLAGAGVAFKLAQALLQMLRLGSAQCPQDKLSSENGLANGNKIPDGWEKWLLDLVALATVADIVPLLGENRTLVKYGLVVLAQTQRIGLKYLMKTAGINPILEVSANDGPAAVDNLISRIEAGMRRYSTNLTARILGFSLAPRLNAASRMEHANIAYQLLTSKLADEANKISLKLDDLNRKRQKLVENITKEIEGQFAALEAEKVIFAYSEKWPLGVAGLVAGRLKDKYNRPTFIFNITGGRAKGSIRSIAEFNVVEAMAECSHLLEKFGGHPCAAGCELAADKLGEFKKCLEQIADRELKGIDLTPTIAIDYEFKIGEIDWPAYDWTRKFAPFGKDNPSPLFMLLGAEIINLRKVGNDDKHLKIELKGKVDDREKRIGAIGFNHGIKYEELKVNDKVDIVFEFLVNEWNGTRELELKVIDLKKSEARNPNSNL